ncbi:hypothetical protein [Halobacterium litoreum]|uniref:DUF7978 domain-containing protein n=1 Tax=Halobacterium litoreum TaxID=2039234 RepID=A0ABD5NBM0_9EURY|nr:hypothetical protein [Halobacterium litoreum]UHH14710.1 hypothetical protein LT972_06835 [Halobacterium litoreum]
MDFPGALYRDWRDTARAAVAGVVAFLAGFAATFVLEYDEARDSAGFVEDVARFLGPDAGPLFRQAADWLEPDPVQVTGWFFYASHYVPLDVRVTALGNSAHRVVNVRDLPVWDGALVLVPPAVLLVAGFVVAARVTPDASPVLTGVRVAFGYVAAAVVALRWVAYSRDAGLASASVGPDAWTVAINCGAYALVFGTIGAIVYAAYVRRT